MYTKPYHILYTCTRERYGHVHCHVNIQAGHHNTVMYTTTCTPLYHVQRIKCLHDIRVRVVVYMTGLWRPAVYTLRIRIA